MSLDVLPAPRRWLFLDHERVASAHRQLPDAASPRFGQRDVWDFNGVLARPANLPPSHWRLNFARLAGAWNLRARELCMILLNPRHPRVVDSGVHLSPTPRSPKTMIGVVQRVRELAAWATALDMPEDLRQWMPEDLHRYLDHLRSKGNKVTALMAPIDTIKDLHEFGQVLTGGGLLADPWPGRSARAVLAVTAAHHQRTPVIPPQTWLPLVRAAWSYIDVFSVDVARARDRWQELHPAERPIDLTEVNGEALLREWLADPANRVPVHRPSFYLTGVNWTLLNRMLGVRPTPQALFAHRPGGRGALPARRRAMVLEAVAAGRIQYGLLPDPQIVERPDGTRGPWHECLDGRALVVEIGMVRTAAYLFTAALSMMRDSEILEITKGSVVEHYGSPAVRSRLIKHQPDRPVRHWWIVDPVARAIEVAELFATDPHLVFGRLRGAQHNGTFHSRAAITAFIAHVNAQRHLTGLPEIVDHPVSPHMFRRTMSMLASTQPGAEIALGMQLQHAVTRAMANRTTQGYYEPDPSWARHIDQDITAARFDRLTELFDAHRRGETIGYGPGADRITATFNAVTRAAEKLRATGKARHGDARVEYDLLRKTHVSIRFGTLNHCALDENNPVGAKCLENAVVPDGHRGALIDRCHPGRCANSIVTAEHLPHHRAAEHQLLTLLESPKIAPCRRDALQRQLTEVRDVIRKAPS